MRIFITLPLFYIFFMSCECFNEHNGYVFDEETNEPIYRATVSSYEVNKRGAEVHNNDAYTDSSGFYSAGYGNVGSVGKCPRIRVYIVKDGYRKYKIENRPLDVIDTIYLEKE